MTSIENFATQPFITALKSFFGELKVPINPLQDLPILPVDIFGENYKSDNKTHQLIDEVYVVGTVDDSAFNEIENKSKADLQKEDYVFILILGIKLKIVEGKSPTRGQLAELTRLANKAFNTNGNGNPVTVVFKYGSQLALANTERQTYTQNWRAGEKIGKVSMLKDIKLEKPLRAHKNILIDLGKHKATDFNTLYQDWQKVLNTKELNDEFYRELFKWYLWAKSHASFPNDTNEDNEQYLSESLIRFISRILFVWFMKEKDLITDQIFNLEGLKTILKDFYEKSKTNTYYKAILQNLFFATLNVPIEERKWIDGQKKNKAQQGDPLIYRFEKEFVNSEAAINKIFMQIPFLNGGLFDCLDDRPNAVFTDGFTKNEKKQAQLPNYLFFGENQNVDLSQNFEDDAKEKRKWQNQSVTGIIDLLNNYKFTVEENTPLEIDVALDPELLGKVFENLLASFNPETKTTARKQTGSFYTPREIVNYMVDESLKQHLHTKLPDNTSHIEQLFKGEVADFDEGLKQKIIQKLFDCKILDPACGSGAYPMGILHKMVELMTSLDPQNKYLKQIENQKLDKLIGGANNLSDNNAKAQTIAVLEKQKEILQCAEYDYVRKLYIIENCIYGVDIQPIAIQISKLRFFISLLVEQIKITSKDNMGIEPLPNMDFKLVAANTLIAPPKDANDYGIFADNKNEFFDDFERLAHDYFTLHTPESKKVKKQELIALIKEKVEEKTKSITWQTEIGKKAQEAINDKALWQSYPNLFKEKAVGFFEIPYFFPKVKDGFDIVIGNPPYGVSIKNEYRTQVMSHLGKVPDFEIYYYFIEVSKSLVKSNGIKSYIIPNTFLFNVFASDYRKQLLDNWEINIIDCTAFKIFEGATVLNAITILKKVKGSKSVRYKNTKTSLNFNELINQETLIIGNQELLLNNQNWSLAFKLDRSILILVSKIKNKSVKLESLFPEFSQGLIAYDKYQGQSEEIIKNRVFHFDSPQKKEGLKKNLWGEDVNRYVVNWNEKEWIDYLGGIANPRLPKFFKGERILIREITNPRIFAAYTIDELYHDPSIIVVLGNETYNIKFLLSILNSKLLTFYHFNSSPKASKGAFPKILVEDIKNFPIKQLSPEAQLPFITLVDNILEGKKVGMDTLPWEAEIDLRVYKLYELTYAEVLVVEPGFGMSEVEYEGFVG